MPVATIAHCDAPETSVGVNAVAGSPVKITLGKVKRLEEGVSARSVQCLFQEQQQ